MILYFIYKFLVVQKILIDLIKCTNNCGLNPSKIIKEANQPFLTLNLSNLLNITKIERENDFRKIGQLFHTFDVFAKLIKILWTNVKLNVKIKFGRSRARASLNHP